jgi:hypothetical protein
MTLHTSLQLSAMNASASITTSLKNCAKKYTGDLAREAGECMGKWLEFRVILRDAENLLQL